MSVVGELPIDITCPPGFPMPEHDFEMHKCGHTRRPSHRRTASLVMYFDDDFIGPNPAEHRPGTPPATQQNLSFRHQGTFSAIGEQQKLEEISWGHVGDLKVKTSPRTPLHTGVVPTLARSSVGSSTTTKRAADKPDVQELFGSIWGGAEAGRSLHESITSRSSQGTPLSRRSTGSPLKNFFNIFKPKQSYDRESMPSPGGLSATSLENLGGNMKAFQHGLSNYEEDDCESSGTVVQLDGESDDALSSQAEDANMRNDLYSEFDRVSLGDETLTNDSIDEDEFPLDTIAESTLESQRTQESLVGDNSNDVPLKTDTVAGESLGSPKSPIVHSHTVSEASQPESDMPLPEIVTGSILQGLHDEISMKLAEDLAMNTREHPSEDITYTEFQTRDFPMNDCQQRSSTKSPRTEGTMHFGVRWVRVTPDKNLVSNIYSCVAKAAELVVNNWQWVPVALPIVLIAINC